MFLLGARNEDYDYKPQEIFDNIDYFKVCHNRELSAYKALEFFFMHLEEQNKSKKS
jgi:hypothetical protein